MVSWVELISTRLQSTQKPIREELDVCCCPRSNGLLRYDISSQLYAGQGSCDTDKICASLMIAKHRALLSSREFKKYTHRETTLDDFFQ